MQHARTVLGHEHIVAVTAFDNQGSINVLRHVGFIFERLAKFPRDDTDKRVFVCVP